MSQRLDMNHYTNIGNHRAITKLNILYKNNNLHKEDLQKLYKFITGYKSNNNKYGVSYSLWITYNCMKLLEIGYNKFPTNITYVYLSGKSRLIQTIAMLYDVENNKFKERKNSYKLEKIENSINLLLDEIGFTLDEKTIIKEILEKLNSSDEKGYELTEIIKSKKS